MTNAVNIAQSGSNNVTMRNRIINGAMTINQRGGTISATGTDNVYGVDRWQMRTTSGSTVVSMQQSSTAPAGFINSFLLTVTTADASLASGDVCCLVQKIEGLNISDLGWGTANAQPVTVSFWVRSSVTGTYGAGVQNSAGNRSYPSSFVINAADTFEYKTITIPGDTTGTWLTTNGVGVYLWFSLATGANALGTANSWAAADYRGTTGQVNWGATLSNTFYITGVQLEEGTAASPFEYRLYGQELVLCQRYFYRWDIQDMHAQTSWASVANDVSTRWVMPVTMRAKPTATVTGTFGDNSQDWSIYNNGAWRTISSFGVGTTNRNSIRMDAGLSGGINASDAVGIYCLDTDGTGGMYVSAEL
jgi:hypothetical protein